MRRLVLAAAVVLAAGACSGGEGVGDVDDESTTTTGSTTTTEGAAPGDGAAEGSGSGELDEVAGLLAEPDLGHRFTMTIGPETTRGDVETSTRFRLVTKLDSVQFELLVVDGAAFRRAGGQDSLATAQYIEVEVPDFVPSSALAEIEEALEDEVLEPAVAAFAARTVIAQHAALAPVELAAALAADGDTQVAEVDGGDIRIRGRLDLDRLTDGAAGRLLEGPLAEVLLDGEGNPVRLRFPGVDDATPAVLVEILDYGDGPEIDEPAPGEIDLTPTVGEEGLLAFVDAPLVVPVPVPGGLELVDARVLPPEETIESCNQVGLIYADPNRGEVLRLFVLPAACATAFDDTPFDLTVGGHPARDVHILELEVGDAVVQLDASLPAPVIEEIAATLAPVTAEELIAMVTTG